MNDNNSLALTMWNCRPPRTPGVYPLEDTGEVEKQRIDSAALHRISCSCVGSPCFAAFLALVCFSGLFAFTQLFFRT